MITDRRLAVIPWLDVNFAVFKRRACKSFVISSYDAVRRIHTAAQAAWKYNNLIAEDCVIRRRNAKKRSGYYRNVKE